MKRSRRRGISFGSVLMLLITFAVIAGFSYIMPKLSAGNDTVIDTQNVVNVITADLNLPELTLSDIPIFSSNATSQPEPTYAPAMNFNNDTALTTQAAAAVAVITPTPEPRYEPQTFTLCAGGTVSFSSAIRQSAYDSGSKTYDFSDIFTYISDETQSDLCLLTLENNLDASQKATDVNSVADTLDALHIAGVDMLAMGHSNILDLGLSGLKATLKTIDDSDFMVVGAYATQSESQQPVIVNLQGVQVCVLHYTEALSAKGKSAVKNDDCAYAVPILNIDTVTADISKARSQGAQVVIVSLNWGSVQKSVTKTQKNLVQQIADAGADVILGAHSQIVEGLEFLTATRADGTAHQVLAAYSLGALLTESRDTKPIAGMLLHLQITYDETTRLVSFDQVQYTPTYIWRYRDSGQYQYRVVASDLTPPDTMDDKQKEVMARALKTTQTALNGSPVTLRVAGD